VAVAVRSLQLTRDLARGSALARLGVRPLRPDLPLHGPEPSRAELVNAARSRDQCVIFCVYTVLFRYDTSLCM
jgi:hypothetical protein